MVSTGSLGVVSVVSTVSDDEILVSIEDSVSEEVSAVVEAVSVKIVSAVDARPAWLAKSLICFS